MACLGCTVCEIDPPTLIFLESIFKQQCYSKSCIPTAVTFCLFIYYYNFCKIKFQSFALYINIPIGILQPICAICPKPLNTSRQNNTCTPFKYTYSDIRYMYCTKVPTKNPNPLFKSLLWNYRTSIFTWKWKHKNSTIHSTVPIHLHIQPDLPSWINIVFVWVDRNFQHQHIDIFTKNLFTNIVQSRI